LSRLLHIADTLDRFQDKFGKWLYWLALAMVVVGGFNTIVRYLDKFTGMGISSNMYLELQWYLFSLLFLLGASYTLRHDDHVRVDILYSRLGAKGKAWINVLGTLLLLVPFCLLMIWVSWPAVINSWAVWETSPDPGGLPRYPIKTVIPISFVLILTQGVSMLLRNLAVLMGHEVETSTATSLAGDISVESKTKGGA
jgi:TRAP-type mannitol/chloroaromatic compound transport system permease small subunit